MNNNVLNDFHQYITGLICICGVFELLGMLMQLKECKQATSRKRVRDSELSFHSKRKRKLWSPLVRSLDPNDFKRHHGISSKLFETIHQKIAYLITTKSKYARKTCCRGEVSAVDSRSRLSMTLKHLGGSKIQDIERTHGVSRSTVNSQFEATEGFGDVDLGTRERCERRRPTTVGVDMGGLNAGSSSSSSSPSSSSSLHL